MGNTLFDQVVQATGLPVEPVADELEALLECHGLTPESLTLDDLREVLADYLQSVFLDATATASSRRAQ